MRVPCPSTFCCGTTPLSQTTFVLSERSQACAGSAPRLSSHPLTYVNPRWQHNALLNAIAVN